MRKYFWVLIPAIIVTFCSLAIGIYFLAANRAEYNKKLDSIGANWALLTEVKNQTPCLYEQSKDKRIACRVKLDVAILTFHDSSHLAVGSLVCAQSLSQSFSLTDDPYVTPDRISLVNMVCKNATDALNEELKSLK